MKKICFLTIPFFFIQLIPNLIAENPIILGDDFNNLRLDPYITFYEDSSKTISFPGILQIAKNLEWKRTATLNFAYSNSYYWLKWELANSGQESVDLILEIDNPHLNKLQLFQFHDSSWHSSILTGDHFPFAQREAPHAHFLFESKIHPNQTISYILWIDKHGEQIQAPVRVWRKSEFTNHDSKLHLFWGIVIGFGILFVIFSSLIYTFYPQKLSLYYLLYTIFILIFLVGHTGLGFKLIWPNLPWWQSAARPSSALLMYSFYQLFAREFFAIKKKSGILNYLSLTLIASNILFLIILWTNNPFVGIINEYWYNPEYYEGSDLLIFSKFLGLNFSLNLLFLFILGVTFYLRERKAEALWFTLSFLMLFLGGWSILLVFAGILPDNIITQNFPLLSNSIETLVLAALLANRFNNIQKDNTRLEKQISNQKLINAQKFIEGQLMERKRLSQELHDGININLANVKLKLSLLSRNIQKFSEPINDIITRIGNISQDIRQFSHNLSPTMLDKYGLVDAIQELVDQTNESQAREIVHFSNSVEKDYLYSAIEKHVLYLSIQELILNAIKHSASDIIDVSIETDNQITIAKVIDYGIGYNSTDKTAGIGLINIRSRLELLNGEFHVEKLAKGMKHIIRIPQTIN